MIDSKSNIWNRTSLGIISTNISDFNVNPKLGANYRMEYSSYKNISGNDARVPQIFFIESAIIKFNFPLEGISKKAIYSHYYGLGSF